MEGGAPAYRGTAYVVFEDLPLGPFGNRAPQLGFEVFRRPRGGAPGLEDRLDGVCLIPGAGEFCLATTPVMRREGLTRTTAENLNNPQGRADLMVSLDQLEAQLPHVQRVNLVVGWFGDDLRMSHCRIRPGVERAVKPTEPVGWSVAGVTRDEAFVVSEADGGPAYGGTPSDQTVVDAVRELKARGMAVTLYPFVFMDIPPGGEQPAYPWRGRITGEGGTAADAEVAAFFGGADGWGLRRMARHYAALAAEAGADGLIIGSELRGVTTLRDAGGGYPAVAELRALAAECRAIAGPGVEISLRGGLVGVFRPPSGRRGGGVSSGPAVGGRGHRSCGHRLVPADGRLARGRRPSGRGGRICGAGGPGLSGGQRGGRGEFRLVLWLGRGPGGAGAHADHRRRPWRAVGVAVQGSEELVVQRAP